ncbi:MAG: extracellular solute-binding protein, partial [Erysipelotrichaceae bacterium]|nr:extracellular solute-binding protein [Erysipelotrichaceae bacterium]
ATYMALKEEGCLAPSTPSWAGELDDFFKDAEGYWYGTIKTPVMMFYNTEAMTAEDAPKDWKDLADPKYDDQIIIRGTAASSSGTLISCWLDYFSAEDSEEAGWDFISKFDQNVKYYDDVKTLIMQAVGKGEAPIGISTLNDIYDNVINNGLPLEPIYSEGGDVVLCDCAAVVNNCANPNAAAAFLEYIGSPEVQAKIANEFLRCPTLDSALAESPEWMAKEIKTLEVDWVNISAHKADWLKTWAADYMNAEIVAAE